MSTGDYTCLFSTGQIRGVALVSVVYKVMCLVVQERLVQLVEGEQLLAEEQGGFRRGRGCRDQLLTLTLLGQMTMMARKGGCLQHLLIFVRLMIV